MRSNRFEALLLFLLIFGSFEITGRKLVNMQLCAVEEVGRKVQIEFFENNPSTGVSEGMK